MGILLFITLVTNGSSLSITVKNKPLTSCKCGIRKLPQGIQPIISLKIAGGEDAEPNEFPWVARIFVRGVLRNFTCGATLINDRYVLTAAHCIADPEEKQVFIVLGDHQQTVREGKE